VGGGGLIQGAPTPSKNLPKETRARKRGEGKEILGRKEREKAGAFKTCIAAVKKGNSGKPSLAGR